MGVCQIVVFSDWKGFFFPLRGLNEGGLDLLYFPNTLLVLIKNQGKGEVST